MKRSHHLQDSTILGKVKKLKAIQRQVNLWNHEEVSNYIQDCPFKNGYKNQLGYVYRDWCEYQGFAFDFHRLPTERELPYVPLEKEIDQLIGAFKNSKYGALLQLLKETGFRPIEAMNLRVRDFNLERQIVTLNNPAKGSNPRQTKISNKLISMLSMLIQGKNLDDKIWNTRHKSIRVTFARVRRNTAKKLGNPNLNKITLKTFRHFKATLEYHRTKDLLYVKELLGHKNIQNTLVYTHLVDWENDDWICKVASSLEESVKLIELGFDFVTDYEGKKVFRKRK